MRIVVRLFAAHRERAGRSSLEIQLPEPATVEDAFNSLARTYPALGETRQFTTFALNRSVVDPDQALSDGDELALLQPVSGGGPEPVIEITPESLSVERCIRAVESPSSGAIVTFLGTVRDNSEGKATDHLEYEAYAEMASEVIRGLAATAAERWSIDRVAAQHRVGQLQIGEVSVVVAVSAPHRGEAFEACRYIIDRLKTEAPIWKKEFGESGEMWVGGPISDMQAPGSSA